MNVGDESVRLAEAMLEFRMNRAEAFPSGMFGETGWEFLLALFIADAHGQPTSGQAIIERIDASPAAGSRWLKFLASEGFVDGDGSGDLTDLLTISPEAVDRMEGLLDHAKGLRAALLPDL